MMIRLTEQQRKALDLQRHIAVTAGAGSGKTTILVERYIHILLTHPETAVHQVLAITYTEKAAAEMKERIVQGIFQRFHALPEQRKRLFDIVQSLSTTQICTIHAFCRQVLKAYALEAGISPEFDVADDLQMGNLFDRVFWEYFFQYRPESEEESRLIERALSALDVRNLRKVFRELYEQRADLEHYARSYATLSPQALQREWTNVRKQYLIRMLQRLHQSGIPSIVTELMAAVQQVAGSSKTASSLLEKGNNFLRLAPESPPDAIDRGISDLLSLFFTQKGEPRSLLNKLVEGVGARDAYGRLLSLLEPYWREYPWGKHHQEQEYTLATIQCGISRLFYRFLSRLEREKRQLGWVDFTDLLIRVRDLLRHHSQIVRQLRRRYPWILVDEFQDIDALQAEILALLVGLSEGAPGERPNLFIVGDPKQSIYGFRRADVTLFEAFRKQIRDHNLAVPRAVGPGWKHPENDSAGCIHLSHNFRSVPPLIAFFNRTFERVLAGNSEFDVPFAPLEAARTFREEPSPAAELRLCLLDEESPSDAGASAQMSRLVSLIEELVHPSPNRVSSAQRRFRYQDIAILIRGRHRLGDIEQALLTAGIPYEIYKGAGFYQKPEVRDMYYLLRCVYQPEDDFALVAALRTPYVGLSDEALFYLSQCLGPTFYQKGQRFYDWLQGAAETHCFQPRFLRFLTEHGLRIELSEEDRRAFVEFWERWQRWIVEAPQLNYSQVLNLLVEELHVRFILAAQPFGRQKLANLDKLMQYTYRFEQTHTARITDFLQAFQGLIRGETVEGEAVLPVEGGNQVRIMTIHAAKGLEFPVVILPFLEARFQNKETLWFHKDIGFLTPVPLEGRSTDVFIFKYFQRLTEVRIYAEEKRIFYVAATRARERLFLIGAVKAHKNAPQKSCLQMLCTALGIAPDRPEESRIGAMLTVRIHRTAAEDGPRSPFPKQETRAPEPAKITESLDEFDESWWNSKLPYLAPLEVRPANPEYSATQLMIFREDPQRYVRHFYLNDGVVIPPVVELEFADEPGGVIWGILMHRLLQAFHLRSPRQDIEAIRSLLWRIGLSVPDREAQEKALSRELHRFRKTELAKWLVSGVAQRAELRLQTQLKPAVLVGVFDRLFRNRDGLWEVVDFKTNRVTAEHLPTLIKKYLLQMRCYALLLKNLFPEQEAYPIQLFFLRPQQGYRMVFSPQHISDIEREVEEIMGQLIEVERKCLSGRWS